jgi:hypothetical protein
VSKYDLMNGGLRSFCPFGPLSLILFYFFLFCEMCGTTSWFPLLCCFALFNAPNQVQYQTRENDPLEEHLFPTMHIYFFCVGFSLLPLCMPTQAKVQFHSEKYTFWLSSGFRAYCWGILSLRRNNPRHSSPIISQYNNYQVLFALACQLPFITQDYLL